MAKIGLVAGEGRMPLEFAKSARSQGNKVVALALKDAAFQELEEVADRTYWLNIDQYTKFVFILLKERLRKIALLGKVPKQTVYGKDGYEKEAKKLLNNVKDNKDYSLLEEITRHFAKFGVEVIDPRSFMPHMIASKGRLTNIRADDGVMKDLDFGEAIAREIAGHDIGQTVIVKNRAVVSVEAMEGTDEVIERSGRIAGEGCVMIKLSRPDQDMRWDIPVIGARTIDKLLEHNFKALAIESGRMFFLEMERLLKKAEQSGLYIQAL